MVGVVPSMVGVTPSMVGVVRTVAGVVPWVVGPFYVRPSNPQCSGPTPPVGTQRWPFYVSRWPTGSSGTCPGPKEAKTSLKGSKTGPKQAKTRRICAQHVRSASCDEQRADGTVRAVGGPACRLRWLGAVLPSPTPFQGSPWALLRFELSADPTHRPPTTPHTLAGLQGVY